MIRYLTTTILFSLYLSASIIGKEALNFAPLSIQSKSELMEEFIPFFSYIEKELKLKSTRFVYEKDYAQIITKFKANQIDIALLGPLPYLKLKKEHPHMQPIVAFKNANNKSTYRCVIAHFGKDAIAWDQPLNVALTQPLSTCGYYATNKLLKEYYSIDLLQQSFDYQFSHHNALFAVLEGEFHIAGVKDSVAREFDSLGIRVLAQSKPFPEFALVVNTQTLSKKAIRRIQSTILNMNVSVYQKWDRIFKNGFEKIDTHAYKHIEVDFDTITKFGNIK